AIYSAGGGNPIDPAGSLSGAKKSGAYITHASLAGMNPTFSYTIPRTMAAGTYTIKSLLLAANGDGGAGGDQWNLSNDVITLTVVSAVGAPNPPTNVIAT